MKNLELLGVQEMDVSEMRNENGGIDGTGRDSNPWWDIFRFPFPSPTFPGPTFPI